MKKYVRDQVLDLLQTIWEIVNQTKKLAPDILKQALADCSFAAQVVEKTLCDGFSKSNFIRYKGAVCELKEQIEKINTNIAQGLPYTLVTKRIRAHLNFIRNLLIADKEIKLEVVFMPYKASMWDCMESVWRAACADPRCEVYVVPIPYYDRITGGKFGAMHYEGGKYPAEVPIIDWKLYNLEERHPNIIFIHNPYDDKNYVTSVHPDYYSKKLKDLTDFLIYIPYFVSFNNIERHFCTCAGVLNADNVIVQSEKIRKSYISFLHEFENLYSCKGNFGNVNEKIVALGSPKLDKVVIKRQDVFIPDSWKCKIYRHDGTKRYVVFYNTSIEELLRNSESVISKLKSVLEFFQGRDDVTLLWRPHPLSEATYKSMRPQLYNEYCAIINDYKQQNYGIYDNTPDMNRAITVADVYYGEWGSALTLSLCAGKPALLQSINNTKQDQLFFRPCAATLYDDQIFMSFFLSNILLRYNLSEGKVEKIHIIDDVFDKNLYISSERVDDKIAFIPYMANKIIIYDIHTDAVVCCCLPEAPHAFRKKGNFMHSITFGKKIYLFGYSYPGIICLNPLTGETKLVVNMAEVMKENYAWDASSLFFDSWPCIYQDAIYTVVRQYIAENRWNVALFKFEPESGKVKIIPLMIDKENLVCSCVTTAGAFLYISFANDGMLVCYNPLNQQSKLISLPLRAVRKTFYRNGKLYILHMDEKDTCYILSEINGIQPLNLPSFSDVQYVTDGEDGSIILLLKNDCAVKMQFTDESITLKSYKFNWGIYRKTFVQNRFIFAMEQACRSQIGSEFLLNENFYQLPDFIDQISLLMTYGEKQAQIFRNQFANPDGTAGEKIYDYVKSEFWQRDSRSTAIKI